MVALVLIASMLSSPSAQLAAGADQVTATVGQVATSVEDSTVTARINAIYLLNKHLNPLNIVTTTRDGNVVITGTVNDEVQKELAEDLALGVRGVRFVDNQLTVINTVVGEKEQRTWRQRVADRAVSAAIKSRLLYYGEFKGLKIGISTVNNVSTLYGVVPSEAHKEAIGTIAAETQGVHGLVNDLIVRPKDSMDPLLGVGRQISDEWLESRVATTLLLNRHIRLRELNVEVDDGICFLSGTVDSVEKQEVAADIARSIRGINEVRNLITVRAEDDAELTGGTIAELSGDVGPSEIRLRGSEPDEGRSRAYSDSPKVVESVLADP